MNEDSEKSPEITDSKAKEVLQKEMTKEEIQKELRQVRKGYNELLGDYRVIQSVNRELTRLCGYYKEMYYHYRQLINPIDKPTIPMWTDDTKVIENDMEKQKDETKKDWDLKPEEEKKKIREEAK